MRDHRGEWSVALRGILFIQVLDITPPGRRSRSVMVFLHETSLHQGPQGIENGPIRQTTAIRTVFLDGLSKLLLPRGPLVRFRIVRIRLHTGEGFASSGEVSLVSRGVSRIIRRSPFVPRASKWPQRPWFQRHR